MHLGAACSSAGRPSIPLLPGHRHVHEHDVGLVLHRLEHGAVGARRLADRLDVGLGVEHAAQAAADDGMVVDDENPDRHGTGTSAATRGPGPGRRLDPERPADERDALAHADESEPAVADAAGSKPRAVVLDDRDHRPSLRVSEDAHAAARRRA